MGRVPPDWVIGLDGQGRIARLEGAPWNGEAVARSSFAGYFLLKALAEARLVVDAKLETESSR
jgi:hypothetical protein